MNFKLGLLPTLAQEQQRVDPTEASLMVLDEECCDDRRVLGYNSYLLEIKDASMCFFFLNVQIMSWC